MKDLHVLLEVDYGLRVLVTEILLSILQLLPSLVNLTLHRIFNLQVLLTVSIVGESGVSRNITTSPRS